MRTAFTPTTTLKHRPNRIRRYSPPIKVLANKFILCLRSLLTEYIML